MLAAEKDVRGHLRASSHSQRSFGTLILTTQKLLRKSTFKVHDIAMFKCAVLLFLGCAASMKITSEQLPPIFPDPNPRPCTKRHTLHTMLYLTRSNLRPPLFPRSEAHRPQASSWARTLCGSPSGGHAAIPAGDYQTGVDYGGNVSPLFRSC